MVDGPRPAACRRSSPSKLSTAYVVWSKQPQKMTGYFIQARTAILKGHGRLPSSISPSLPSLEEYDLVGRLQIHRAGAQNVLKPMKGRACGSCFWELSCCRNNQNNSLPFVRVLAQIDIIFHEESVQPGLITASLKSSGPLAMTGWQMCPRSGVRHRRLMLHFSAATWQAHTQ
ncbi:hypothetical protein GX51_02713 [Blastomyces parvus]|uniref:Uncharacterized protein n=1 Tax=Blastomyces parvus TaxID=2060905 RepID=A0A2B7XB31_9EURO|nr:hypothetical protein GX51_02713 [Blastomyces parvus]